MSKKSIINKTEYKELFNKVNETYKANENLPIYTISATEKEKEMLIIASKKHLKDHSKIHDDTTDWKEFINDIISKVKSSKNIIQFGDYEFIKLRMWLCDLKYDEATPK